VFSEENQISLREKKFLLEQESKDNFRKQSEYKVYFTDHRPNIPFLILQIECRKWVGLKTGACHSRVGIPY
jgi:hypothetical protein